MVATAVVATAVVATAVVAAAVVAAVVVATAVVATAVVATAMATAVAATVKATMQMRQRSARRQRDGHSPETGRNEECDLHRYHNAVSGSAGLQQPGWAQNPEGNRKRARPSKADRIKADRFMTAGEDTHIQYIYQDAAYMMGLAYTQVLDRSRHALIH